MKQIVVTICLILFSFESYAVSPSVQSGLAIQISKNICQLYAKTIFFHLNTGLPFKLKSDLEDRFVRLLGTRSCGKITYSHYEEISRLPCSQVKLQIDHSIKNMETMLRVYKSLIEQEEKMDTIDEVTNRLSQLEITKISDEAEKVFQSFKLLNLSTPNQNQAKDIMDNLSNLLSGLYLNS